MKEQSLARGLSFFSLGLGVAELLAPRQVARLAGINRDHDWLIRMCGLREITAGLGIMQGNPGLFLWSRVAGDAMDISLLLAATREEGNDRRRLNYALAAVAGVTALDVIASLMASRSHTEPGWRIRDEHDYASGFQRSDPMESRACCDDAMLEATQSAAGATDEETFNRGAAQPDALDDLAGHDDGLEQTERPATSTP